MNFVTLLTLVTAGTSILAFQNRNLLNKLVMYPYAMVRQNEWYRIITHAFIHADWMHLIFNMIALWSFGNFVFDSPSSLPSMTSSPVLHFTIMYFGAILFSSISDVAKHKDNQYYTSLGASGVVSAVIFFSILINPWSMILVFFIPCPGIVFGILYLAYSHYMSKKGGDIINHDAHFYGSVFGLLYPLFINPSMYGDFLTKLLHPPFL